MSPATKERGAAQARHGHEEGRLSGAAGGTTPRYDGGPRLVPRQLRARATSGRATTTSPSSHKPVDRTEWDMTPQTYNAYYNPSNNEIVLPAAIFILPGIADSLVDDAVVYALRGRHDHRPRDHPRLRRRGPPVRRAGQPAGLVDGGRRGAVQAPRAGDRPAVRRVRRRRTSLHVNGEATQGENIADLGGILLGWDAFARPSSTGGARRSAA